MREYYVAEVIKNNAGQDTFQRKGDLYNRKFNDQQDAEDAAIMEAKKFRDRQYAVIQVISRVKSEPLYLVQVERSI